MQSTREYVEDLYRYLSQSDDLIVERHAQGGVIEVFAKQRTGAEGWMSVSAFLSSSTGRYSLGDARIVYVTGGKVHKMSKRSEISAASRTLARDYWD